MGLINTDGMVFVGTGSEWFWTALTGVVLAVTFLAIYRQLAIARSASARDQFEAFDREWDSERMLRYRLAVLLALRDGTDPAHVPDGSTTAIANFWSKTGLLARNGDLDVKAFYLGLGGVCQTWWARLSPAVRRWRTEEADPRLVGHFEWLARRMAELDRRAGMQAVEPPVSGPLADEQITSLEEQLRVEEALRTVIVASPDAAVAAPPPAAPTPPAPAPGPG